MKQEIITPVTILKQMLDLDKYVHTLDIHRMDKEGLYHHIITILSKETIQKLNSFKEPDISKQIVLVVLNIANVLPLHFTRELTEQMKKLYTDKAIEEKMTHLVSHKQKADKWEKRKIWLILAAVITLCLIIFLTAR